jgi:hypothetical protein
MVRHRSIWRLVLPSDGTNRSLKHPADADRFRSTMKFKRMLMKRPFRIGGAVSLA